MQMGTFAYSQLLLSSSALYVALYIYTAAPPTEFIALFYLFISLL
jgi:hypothetical protein